MQKRLKFIMILLIGFALPIMPFAVQPATAQANAPWSVAYYDSTNLLGAPVYTSQVDSVGFDWTAGAPAPGINPDFFSARWTSVQNLDAGTYQIKVQADDGVRVFVNNAPLIDQFHTATGRTYTGTFEVPAGQHVIQVDYYEGGGVAFLDFDLNQVSNNPEQPLAVVQAGRLNVRDQPSVLTGDVIAQVALNETLPVIGRTVDSGWWQVVANGVTGWVSGLWVNVLNTQAVPVTDGETPEVTGYQLTATVNLNIRSGPGVSYGIVGWLPDQRSAEIIGRNAANTWWQIRYGDVTGWVSGFYTQLEFGVDIDDIPVTEGVVSTPILTATGNLNIRSGPSVFYSIVGWLPARQQAAIIGRNATNSWWQIQYQGSTGWVSDNYAALGPGTDINSIPITG